MRNAPEVVREVGVYDVRMTTEQQLLHLYSGLLGVVPSAVGVDFRWKVGFEDRLQHQHRCCHADPIPHGRDAQRPEFAVGLRYEHASDRLRSVRLLPERKRQFGQPPLDPVCLDVRKILAVDARRALVRATLGIGMRQNVVAADLVVQSVEAGSWGNSWRAQRVWSEGQREMMPALELAGLWPKKACIIKVCSPYGLQHASEWDPNPCGTRASATCSARSPAASSASGNGGASSFCAMRRTACPVSMSSSRAWESHQYPGAAPEGPGRSRPARASPLQRKTAALRIRADASRP